MKATLALLAALLAAAATEVVPPLASGRATRPEAPSLQEDVPYDGRFTFVRIRFEAGSGGFGGSGERSFRGGREPAWAHDYPRAETNFVRIVEELTDIDPYLGGSRILDMDDPEVFRYPLIYVVEVGSWNARPEEIEALGDYLRKGGFLIVDDFRDRQIYRIEQILAEALPGARILEMPIDHEIFDSFFRIDDPYALIPPYGGNRPYYLGVFEDNDPSKRLMAILNYNNDIGEYWEYSDYGYYPLDLSNEAYKFGINYLVYALTH